MYNYFMPRSDDLPIVQLAMNCDTILAINAADLDIQENDELIFTIKNYDYIGSPAIFLKRLRYNEINAAGEIFIKVSHDIVQYVKPGAFWNLSILKDAYDTLKPTQYGRLTDNGRVSIAYGAHDLGSQPIEPNGEIVGIHLEPLDE